MKNPRCSFCFRPQEETQLMVSGPNGVHICDKCIVQSYEILEQEKQNSSSKIREKETAQVQLVPPVEMKEFLDEYVIGQEEAKRVLCVAVYNHYKRLLNKPKTEQEEEVSLEKSNVLMIGETGTGKTYLARTLARKLQVPFCIADATVLTEAGYVGEDVETVLTRLLQNANGDANSAQMGIVYIDELDKIARKGDNASITRDVSGEGVQQALLKLLEGSDINVPPQGGRKHPEQKYVTINTDNILFICGGAFDGIENVIKKRLNTRPLGFRGKSEQQEEAVDEQNMLQYVMHTDVREFGLIPELLGRLPVLTHLDPLNKEALKLILTQPKNALIRQYEKLFAMEDMELEFTDEGLDFIVGKALDFKLGARGLRSICESVMTDAMFEIPSQKEKQQKKLVIDRQYAEDKLAKHKLLPNLKVA